MASRNHRGHLGPLLYCKISSTKVTPDRQMFIYLYLKTFNTGDTAVSPQEIYSNALFYSHQKTFLNV